MGRPRPAGAGQFRGGQGDISSDAMPIPARQCDRVRADSAGPQKQISYGYSLPAGTRTLVIPIDQRQTR